MENIEEDNIAELGVNSQEKDQLMANQILQSDRETLQTQAMIANRLSRQPRNSEFVGSTQIQNKNQPPNSMDKISLREKDIQMLDVEI